LVDTTIIIQARTASTRLKFKTLFPINNLPLVVFLCKRLISYKYRLIVATSKCKSDDALCFELKKYNINYYRGSLEDVHSRYLALCKYKKKDENIIRLTADNPFINLDLIDNIVNQFQNLNCKFMYIDSKSEKLPYGIAAEIFKVGFFKKVKAKNRKEKEHVTLKFRRKQFEKNIEKFHYNNIIDYSKLRLSIDTIDDYKIVNAIVNKNKNFCNYNLPEIFKKSKNYFNKNRISKKTPIINSTFQKKFILGTAQLCDDYGIKNKNIIRDEYDLMKKGKKILSNAKNFNIKYIDTANCYRNSEKLIGKFQKKEKYNFNIFSKIENIKKNLSEDELITQVNKSVALSLKRLKVKKIYCLQIHNINNLYDYENSLLKCLKKIKAQGTATKIGVSVYTKKDFIKAIKNKHIDVIQFPINILDHRWNNIDYVIKKYGKKKEFLARSIFLQGYLLPEINKNNKRFIKIINNFVVKCKRSNIKDLLINYVKSFKWISKIIIGIDEALQINELYYLFSLSTLNHKQINYIKKNNKIMPEKMLLPNLWK
jgi:spore coat polysaccharide biosynthesis protein SpsF (cytidylyltransferase family)/aryl-alcohol dehydrogenase-like predicted oxidoreductase